MEKLIQKLLRRRSVVLKGGDLRQFTKELAKRGISYRIGCTNFSYNAGFPGRYYVGTNGKRIKGKNVLTEIKLENG